MAEHVGDDLEIHAFGKHQRGVAVTQIVETDCREIPTRKHPLKMILKLIGGELTLATLQKKLGVFRAK